jgi:hypothetical protein
MKHIRKSIELYFINSILFLTKYLTINMKDLINSNDQFRVQIKNILLYHLGYSYLLNLY